MITTLAILLFTTLTCTGLLATWAATSPRHWFLRTALYLAPVSLLLFIPAYEPFVVFAIQGATVAAGVPIARWRRRRNNSDSQPNQPFQFSLTTLLLVMVLVAIGTAVGVRMPEQGWRGWQNILLIGAVSGMATLAGLWIVCGRLWRWWLRLALAVVVVFFFSFPVIGCDWFVIGISGGTLPPPDSSQDQALSLLATFLDNEDVENVWAPVLVSVLCAACLVIWLWVGLAGTEMGRSAKPHRFAGWGRRGLAGAVLLGVGVLLVWPPADVYYRLMTPLPIPVVTMPDPNGYYDFVDAGHLAESVNFGNIGENFDTVTQKQLAVALKTLEPALERLHVGLSKRTRFPVDYTSDRTMEFESIQTARGLARALNGRGRLAKLEGRNEDAANCYLENIRFGYAIRRDQLMLESLVGLACSGIGARELYDHRDRLSTSECGKIIAMLIELEQLAEPDEDVVFRDRIWTQHAFGWNGHLTQILDDLSPGDTWFSTESYFRACNRDRAVMRLLRLELALHALHGEHGGWPDSLAELVPDYVPEVPADPFDPQEAPLRYRRTEDGYLLYSVGTDGEDDGGVPKSDEIDASMWYWEGGDLRLDLLYADEPVETVDEDEASADDNAIEPFEEE